MGGVLGGSEAYMHTHPPLHTAEGTCFSQGADRVLDSSLFEKLGSAEPIMWVDDKGNHKQVVLLAPSSTMRPIHC